MARQHDTPQHMVRQPDAPRPMARLDLGAVSSIGLVASIWHSSCHAFLSQSADCFQMLVDNISFYMDNHHHIIDMTT
jgi:hypothetical protein